MIKPKMCIVAHCSEINGYGEGGTGVSEVAMNKSGERLLGVAPKMLRLFIRAQKHIETGSKTDSDRNKLLADMSRLVDSLAYEKSKSQDKED